MFLRIYCIHTLILLQGKNASMGMAKGSQPLPFGHSAEAAVDIEGLVVSTYTIALYMIFIDIISY